MKRDLRDSALAFSAAEKAWKIWCLHRVGLRLKPEILEVTQWGTFAADRTNYGNHRGGYNIINIKAQNVIPTKRDKASQISQYDLPRQHVLVDTSQLCETLSPVDLNGNNFPQIASPPLPPWNLRIWRVFVVSPREKPSCSSTTIGLGRTCDPHQPPTGNNRHTSPTSTIYASSTCWHS